MHLILTHACYMLGVVSATTLLIGAWVTTEEYLDGD